MKKRIFSVFAAVMLIPAFLFIGCSQKGAVEQKGMLSGNESGVQLEKSDEYTECAANSFLSLWVNGKTGIFYVENHKDGNRWYSSPVNAREDGYANRPVQNQMLSNLLISYKDIETGETSIANTAIDADISICYANNNVRFVCYFGDIKATVTLELTLKDDFLEANVDAGQMKLESKNVKITEISLLPYFCSGSETDEGYLVLGDGSGALVNFRNGKQLCESYKRRIYGEEPTDETREFALLTQNEGVRMPVCGVKRGDSAMLVIGEDGAENGFLNANPNYKFSSYANAYMSYKLLESMDYAVGSLDSTIYDKKGLSVSLIKQKYCFLSGDDANYSGMAREYGEYLRECFGKEERTGSAAQLYVDIYAAVAKEVSHLGVITNDIVPITTASQAREIFDDLSKSGVSASGRYLSWNTSELKQKPVSGIRIPSKLQKGFSVKQLCEEYNILPAVSNTQIYSGGSFLSNITSASFSLMGLPYKWNGHSLSTLNENKESYYRLSADKLLKSGMILADAYSKRGFKGAAFADIGNMLYTDYRGSHKYRGDIMEIELEILKRTAESAETLALSSPNAYAAGYADIIFDTPLNHSGNNLLDESIPFYSIAASRISECVAPAFNNNNIGKDVKLYSVSFGCAPCYSWIYENASVLIGTSLSKLSNVNYRTTSEEAKEDYARYQNIIKGSNGGKIYSHRYIDPLLTETVYENGLKVYVNFSGQLRQLDGGISIAAKSYEAVLP